MRVLQRMLLIVCALALALPAPAEAARQKHGRQSSRAAAASGVADPRYADIVMDPVTGEVFHAANADARRYPASLTKMMTLYLLFEALAANKTDMDARLDISEKAATMPQTNLALRPGDSIPIDIAIKALIVRSANDVAWVVGEALGGDINRFTDMMTAKARQLGMRSTVFKNPNGLPNDGQYTTARDMAKLGIALKRDFPQYYPLFQTRQFSYEGVTYYTHNRVMLRYTGTDGIKTGYIGKSGFNLVSSVVRGGRPLVGVVMGGASGGWRDNRMIQLLDASYGTIAGRGGKRGKIYAANLPLNKAGKPAGLGGVIAVAASEQVAEIPNSGAEDGAPAEPSAADASPAAATSESAATVFAPVVGEVATNSPAKPLPPEAILHPTPSGPVVIMPKPTESTAPKVVRVEMPAAQPVPVALAASKPPVANNELVWGIQVGAFSTEALAQAAARQAVQIANNQLKSAKISVLGPQPTGAAVHRARLENLSQLDARKACEALISKNSPCFIYHLGRDGL